MCNGGKEKDKKKVGENERVYWRDLVGNARKSVYTKEACGRV